MGDSGIWAQRFHLKGLGLRALRYGVLLSILIPGISACSVTCFCGQTVSSESVHAVLKDAFPRICAVRGRAEFL